MDTTACMFDAVILPARTVCQNSKHLCFALWDILAQSFCFVLAKCHKYELDSGYRTPTLSFTDGLVQCSFPCCTGGVVDCVAWNSLRFLHTWGHYLVGLNICWCVGPLQMHCSVTFVLDGCHMYTLLCHTSHACAIGTLNLPTRFNDNPGLNRLLAEAHVVILLKKSIQKSMF